MKLAEISARINAHLKRFEAGNVGKHWTQQREAAL
jgi:hypothetical protein